MYSTLAIFLIWGHPIEINFSINITWLYTKTCINSLFVISQLSIYLFPSNIRRESRGLLASSCRWIYITFNCAAKRMPSEEKVRCELVIYVAYHYPPQHTEDRIYSSNVWKNWINLDSANYNGRQREEMFLFHFVSLTFVSH